MGVASLASPSSKLHAGVMTTALGGVTKAGSAGGGGKLTQPTRLMLQRRRYFKEERSIRCFMNDLVQAIRVGKFLCPIRIT
jgi:hypothetical protein